MTMYLTQREDDIGDTGSATTKNTNREWGCAENAVERH